MLKILDGIRWRGCLIGKTSSAQIGAIKHNMAHKDIRRKYFTQDMLKVTNSIYENMEKFGDYVYGRNRKLKISCIIFERRFWKYVIAKHKHKNQIRPIWSSTHLFILWSCFCFVCSYLAVVTFLLLLMFTCHTCKSSA